MRRPGKPTEPEEPMLFDLPLSAPGSDEDPDEPPMRAPRQQRSESRRPAPESERSHETTRTERPRPVPVASTAPPAGPPVANEEPAARGEFAGPGRRAASGLADIVVHVAVAVVALLGCRALSVEADFREIPAFALFLLSFSFLYTVLPLAFWGHTPGMAWAAITSHNRDGEPLTFDQTVRRWLGGLLTMALLGLPLLVAPGGRTLTDWISGSATFPFDDEEEDERGR
jgi:uncharacterized RDD family membrane protein YckC